VTGTSLGSPERTVPSMVVENAVRHYGGVKAVDGCSFSLIDGQITGLIGPNGAGKSTMLGMVAGAVTPTSGRIRFQGSEIGGLPSYKISRLGIIRTFQTSREFGGLTVLENLVLGAPIANGETFRSVFGSRKRTWKAEEARAVEKAHGLLAKFDLTGKEDELAGTLSGGQKRILELLRAVMAAPRLLLLDEPMAGVHRSNIDRMCSFIKELQSDGVTMLIIEHELGIVDDLCDTVVVMARGRTIHTGTMAEARNHSEVMDAYLVG
jgi:ABC-type branched-subunit amino acid transport system ATPase component